MAASADLLALEGELLARLRQHLASQKPQVHVLSQDDLAGVAEEKQLVPAVHVVYFRYRVKQSRGDGKAALVEQTWLVVVATRNARNLASASGARSQAGQIAKEVMQSVMGWQAPGAATPFKLADGPGAKFQKGFGYLPLAFTADVAVTN